MNQSSADINKKLTKIVCYPDKYRIVCPNVEAKQAQMYCNSCHSWANITEENCPSIFRHRDHLGFITFQDEYYYDAGFCMRPECNEKRAARKKKDDENFYEQEARCRVLIKKAEDRIAASKKKRLEESRNPNNFAAFWKCMDKQKNAEINQTTVTEQINEPPPIPELVRQTNLPAGILFPEEELLSGSSPVPVPVPVPDPDPVLKADETNNTLFCAFTCELCNKFVGCFCNNCYECGTKTLIEDLETFQDLCQACYNKSKNDHDNDDDIAQDKRYYSDFYDSD